MEYLVNVLEPTDLWYLQNNINKETNKFFHPTKNIPFAQQVEIKLENSGVIIQKGSLHRCIGQLTYGVYKSDNRLRDIWVSMKTETEFNAPVYKGTGKVYLEPRQKGRFLHYTSVEISEGEQWEFDDNIFQFCSDDVILGAKRLKFKQIVSSTDGGYRLVIAPKTEQKATVVVGTSEPTKLIQLKRNEILLADYDMVKGFTNGIQEDYRKLGHFGRGGGEGYVWTYEGEGKLLVSETEGMGLS